MHTNFTGTLPPKLKKEIELTQTAKSNNGILGSNNIKPGSNKGLKTRLIERIVKTHQYLVSDPNFTLSSGIEQLIPVELEKGATKWLIANHHWPYKDIDLDGTIVIARIPRNEEATTIEVNIYDDPDRIDEYVSIPIKYVALNGDEWDKTRERPWEAETS